MPVNNFEEDVRKKMEELRFVPSGDVWTKVEEKIREDRKRRRFLLWLQLTGLLLGGLIWFAWPVKDEKTQAQRQPGISTYPGNNTPAGDTANASRSSSSLPSSSGLPPSSVLPSPPAATSSAIPSPKPAPVSATGHAQDAVVTAQPKTASAANARGAGSDSHGANARISWKKSPVITTEAEYFASMTNDRKKHSGGLISKKGIRHQQQARPVAGDPGQATGNDGNEKEPDLSNPGTAFSAASATMAKPGVDKDSANRSGITSVVRDSGKDSASSAMAKTKKATVKKNKTEWGFTLAGGVSKQLEQNNIASGVLNRAILNSSVYVIQRSVVNAGPAFSAGFAMARQIGKTWRMQTGLQYAYASSKLPGASQRSYSAGAAANPTFLLDYGALYAPGSGGTKNKPFVNRYQFFQLPVMVEKQFGVRSPLSVQAGLAPGYLTGIHALIYEPLLDQYLQDNAQFNRFQLSGIVGVYWKFKIDQHWSLRAGPEMQYQFTDLMKSSVPLNDHLLTGALRIVLLRSSK